MSESRPTEEVDETLDDTKLREVNAFLRERFLYSVSSMCNKKCKIRLFENTEVSGIIKAFDLNFENVIVENLKTPLPGTLNCVILRTSDILTITEICDEINCL